MPDDTEWGDAGWGDAGWDDAVLNEVRQRLERAVAKICPRSIASQREDLVQEALLRVVRLKDKTEEMSHAYLKRVAYSVLVDEIRRRRVRPEVLLEDDEPEEPANAPGPERETWGRQIGEALRLCLSKLREPRRRPVTLQLLGYKVPQIAEQLDWSRKKTENAVYRGLGDLRRCLSSQGVQP